MNAKDGSIDMVFIVSTDKQKADPKTRKLIRSQVMRGKNKIKPRRKPRSSHHGDTTKVESLITNGPIDSSSISRLLSSKFSTICFADTVEPTLIEDVLLFSSIFSKAMFTLDQCITTQTPGMPQAWFTPLLFDPAYLNAVCFTIQTYFDELLTRTRSAESQRRNRMQYAKTVRILQERLALDDDSVRLSDSTIMTVLALSGHAYTTGDFESANRHSIGLLKLVGMRGVDTFAHNTKLYIEIIRCDLGMAIDGVSKPLLFPHDKIPWPLPLPSNLTAASNETKQLPHEPNNLLTKLDPKLSAIWTSISSFCSLINTAIEKKGPQITEEQFLHNMPSITYTLLHQHFKKGTSNETYRLALLAFSSPIFIHWNRVELFSTKFTSTFREALVGLEVGEHGYGVTPQEYTWLLMVCALSMAHEADGMAWLKHRLRWNMHLCNVLTWDEMRHLLSSFCGLGWCMISLVEIYLL